MEVEKVMTCGGCVPPAELLLDDGLTPQDLKKLRLDSARDNGGSQPRCPRPTGKATKQSTAPIPRALRRASSTVTIIIPHREGLG